MEARPRNSRPFFAMGHPMTTTGASAGMGPMRRAASRAVTIRPGSPHTDRIPQQVGQSSAAHTKRDRTWPSSSAKLRCGTQAPAATSWPSTGPTKTRSPSPAARSGPQVMQVREGGGAMSRYAVILISATPRGGGVGSATRRSTCRASAMTRVPSVMVTAPSWSATVRGTSSGVGFTNLTPTGPGRCFARMPAV